MNSIPTSPASSVAVRKVAVICELKYERVSGVTPNYLIRYENLPLEGKNSLLGTDLVYKTDQQQLIQGTVRQETCTQENCITVERENYLGARDRFVS